MLNINVNKKIRAIFSARLANLLLIIVLFFNLSTFSKTIIWDLGDTLIRSNNFSMAYNIGIKDFLFYSIIDWKNPKKIKNHVFNILEMVSINNADNSYAYFTHDNNQSVPKIMSDWLRGKISSQKICHLCDQQITELTNRKYFKNKRQIKLVKNTISTMFSPKKLAESFYPIKSTVKILKECFNKLDKNNKAEHQLYILSNFDTQTFNYLVNLKNCRSVFRFFRPENTFISGNLGLIKPDPKIYTYLLEKHKLDPKECVFIDNQQENINIAKKLGITGILFKNSYKKLKHDLQLLKVI